MCCVAKWQRTQGGGSAGRTRAPSGGMTAKPPSSARSGLRRGPPRAMLLNLAGAIEVLLQAHLAQDGMRFWSRSPGSATERLPHPERLRPGSGIDVPNERPRDRQ